jgi:hypothetical protein
MVRIVPRSLWLAILLLGFTTSPVVAAELHWEAPEGCPDVHALERESEQALGEPLAAYPLTVVGSVTRDDTQLRLSLRITLPAQAQTRERELQATSCQELLEAAAVAIALAAAESGERTSPEQVPQSRDIEPPPRAATPAADSGEPMQLALSAAGAGAIGALPELGLGGELQVAWLKGWLRIGLSATWFPGRSMQLTDEYRGTFGMYYGELLLCGQYSLPRARAFACATGALGQMGSHLDGPQLTRTAWTAWRALGVRVGISYPVLPPLQLTVSLAVMAPLTAISFYAASRMLYELAPVNASLLLGALFNL